MNLIKDGFKNEYSTESKRWKDVKSGFTHFGEGDIVFAKITPCFENRKSVVLKKLENKIGAGTTELHVLRPYLQYLNSDYVLLFLKTELFIKNGVLSYTGTAGQQRISKDFVLKTYIPIPPRKEQDKIVNLLNNLFLLF